MIHLRSEKDSRVFKQEKFVESGFFPVTCAWQHKTTLHVEMKLVRYGINVQEDLGG